MTLTITYETSPLGFDVPPTKVAMPNRAELGSISMGGISPEDPTASLALVGHRPIHIDETACTTQPRLFTGWTVERNVGRSLEQGQFVGPDPSIADTTTVDLNAALGFRIITWTDGKRGEESVDDRLYWLLHSNYVAGPDGTLFDDTGYVKTGFSLLMDACDYRGSYPADVLADMSTRYATVINYFVFWDPAPTRNGGTPRPGLFWDYIGVATMDCSKTISNDMADSYPGGVPSTTCFAPIVESRLERTPEAVYSDVIVNYANGSCYRILDSTATAFIKRGTSISRPHIGKLATAQAAGDAWLAQHNVETDRITTTIHVPRTVVGLIQAGMRMDVKFTHLTDYTSFTSMRIVACNPRPVDDLAHFYDVDLELVSPRPMTVALSMTLFQHYSGFYGDVELYWPDGSEVVTWATDGDHPSGGFSAEPALGPVEFYPTVPLGTQGKYRGIRVLADALLDIDLAGGFGGVAGNWGGGKTQITAEFRQNGAIISSQTQDEPQNPPPAGAYFWGGTFSFTFTGIAAAAGDEFEISVSFIHWVGSNYFATIPAESNAETHFRVSGVAGWNGTLAGGPIAPKPGVPTVATTDPTVDDDADAGYLPGAHWINTSTGEEFVLVDDTPGAAVWQPTTGITVEDEGSPLVTLAGTLNFVGAGVVASGTGATKSIAISGAAVADILDLPTAEMDAALVLAPNGAGGVEFRAEAGGGGANRYATAIPLMTSATTPSGIASDSTHTSPALAWEAMGGDHNGWLSDGSALPQWIGYAFATAKTAIAYGFRPWFVDNYPDRTPTAWEFQGSNDGFSTHDVLDSVSGWSPASSSTEFAWAIASPASYNSYRLVISANGGNAYVGLGRFVIYAQEDPVVGVAVVRFNGELILAS